jgi:DNA-binding PucR family transcriptional regulator
LLEFARRYTEPLIDYDRAHDGGLIHTLSAYIRNSYRLNDTARELIVHPNTVKYRLQKIEELSGARLDDAEGLMNLQLALRVHQLNSA